MRPRPRAGPRSLGSPAPGCCRQGRVERATAARPVHLLLDRHASRLQALLPLSRSCSATASRLERAALGAVRRHVAAGTRGRWLEQQQHAVAALEEHEQAILFAVQLQAEHVAIEPLGGGQVVDVEDGPRTRSIGASAPPCKGFPLSLPGNGASRPKVPRHRCSLDIPSGRGRTVAFRRIVLEFVMGEVDGPNPRSHTAHCSSVNA